MKILKTPQPVQLLAPIVKIETVAARHFLMTLRAPAIALRAQAGQFVHLLERDPALNDPLLRRAFSILATRSEPSYCDEAFGNTVETEMENKVENKVENGEIDILFRVQGAVTSHLSRKNRGDFVDIIGPLGQPFDLDLFHVKQDFVEEQRRPILVGGGVGVPPLIFLGETLRRRGMWPIMLLGARQADEVVGQTHFRSLQIETQITTDDGSVGPQGRVTDLLATVLQSEARAVIYACGPLPMLKAVAKMAETYGAPCQVSLEENMPCGIGVCNGCVVPMKARAHSLIESEEPKLMKSDYERYQRICVAGPAVWSHLVDWEAI